MQKVELTMYSGGGGGTARMWRFPTRTDQCWFAPETELTSVAFASITITSPSSTEELPHCGWRLPWAEWTLLLLNTIRFQFSFLLCLWKHLLTLSSFMRSPLTPRYAKDWEFTSLPPLSHLLVSGDITSRLFLVKFLGNLQKRYNLNLM